LQFLKPVAAAIQIEAANLAKARNPVSDDPLASLSNHGESSSAVMPKHPLDHQLDRLWDKHLHGMVLPGHITAHLTELGPELQIELIGKLERWCRRLRPIEGRYWRLILSPVED
jgi:hypothetical protein